MLTIVWDVDDVLNNLMHSWFSAVWKPQNKKSILEFSGITENPPHKLLGIAKREYLESLDAFRLSKDAGDMKPNPEILRWFAKHGKKYNHIALTARPAKTIPPSAEWVFRYFGAWIRTFAFVPSKRENGSLREHFKTKKEYLDWFGKADIFVDDSPENIRAAKSLGIKTVLIPQPWNNSKLTLKELLDLLNDMCRKI